MLIDTSSFLHRFKGVKPLILTYVLAIFKNMDFSFKVVPESSLTRSAGLLKSHSQIYAAG